MPILFVHGVAVRDEDDPAFVAVERLTRGAEWGEVQAALRTHLAPVVRPSAPERVAIERVYWGDLGAQQGQVLAGGRHTFGELAVPAALTVDELGAALERQLFEQLPPAMWPAVVRAVWSTVRDSPIRAQLAARPAKRQGAWLERQVRERLSREAPELTKTFGPLAAGVAATGKRNVRRAMGEVRRPFHAVVPIFVGDVMRYLAGRGVPGAPGPIIARVIDGLMAVRDAQHGAGEALVIVTHSMGGQLIYDTLTAFADDVPGGLPFVDFWGVSGGQVGLFAELGMFLALPSPALVGVPPSRLGVLWNAWSSSDVLSFPAEGRVARAQDSDFAYTGTLAGTHLAYLRDPVFYQTLAAKVSVHAGPSQSRTRR